jgi:hypothetical protein
MDAVRERRASAARIVLAFVVVFAVVVAIADSDHDLDTPVFLLVAFGPFAVFGALVARWWTLALPLICSLVYIGSRWVIDQATGECSVCTSDDDWGSFPVLFLVVGTLPVTLALLGGLIVGALVRR